MRFPESLRLRIQIWHGFLLAAVLTGFSLAAYRYQVANDLRRVDTELRQHMRILVEGMPNARRLGILMPRREAVRDALRDFHLPAAREALFEQSDGKGFYYLVWLWDGKLTAHSAGAPADLGKPEFHFSKTAIMLGERTRGLMREAFMFTRFGDCLLVGRSMEPELAVRREYASWLTLISGTVLALGLAVGWWIATRAIRPIGVITSTARRIATGELSERIPVREGNSELGRLSVALNETFAQLEESFARQSRFTADAAHELRTPVAIILAKAQGTLNRERDAATYRQALEACVEAARRLNQLTESLLELSAYDDGAKILKMDACDVAGIVRETVAQFEPLVRERLITLTCYLAPGPCRADSSRIAQIILNLLSNALDYTPAGGCITLRTFVESGQAVFVISDTGCGISPGDLSRLFTRFCRADASRNRRIGGAGLGLAICKAIADAHHATLEAASIPGQGSTFTLRIPTAPE